MCSVTTGGLSRNMSTSYEMLRFFVFFLMYLIISGFYFMGAYISSYALFSL